MMIKRRFLLLTLCSVFLLSSCAKNTELELTPQNKPVEVQSVVNKEMVDEIGISGIVMSESISKLSFKASGKLKNVYVKNGQRIKAGQLIAELERDQIQLGSDSSNLQLESALLSLEKATDTVNYLDNQYSTLKTLYDQGTATKNTLDELKLRLDLAKTDLETAKKQAENAKVASALQSSYLEDTKLYAEIGGTILDVLYKKGEILGSGYPVVLLESPTKVFQFGVTQKDLKYVEIGKSCRVVIDERAYPMTISEVATAIDSQTQTFLIKGQIKGSVTIGSFGYIYISVGTIKGTQIPLTAIMSSDTDYVYVVQEGKVQKKKVTLTKVIDNIAWVQGLNEKDLVVIKGMKSLNPSDSVTIIEK